MQLNNFEKFIDDKSLEIGKKYFDKELIHFIPSSKNGVWKFFATETVIYRCEITMEKDMSISHYHCNCPDFNNKLCSHIIASLFYLRKNLKVDKEKDTFGNFLINKNEKDYFKELRDFTRKYLRDTKDRNEFLKVIPQVLQYFNQTSEIIENKQLALKLCLFLINTISKIKYKNNDFNNEIIKTFDEIIIFIENHILEQNCELFNIIFDELNKSKNRYEFEKEKLVELCCYFMKTNTNKQKMKQYIKNLILTENFSTTSSKSIYKEFYVRFFR